MRQTFMDLAKVATQDYKDRNFCTVAALALTLDWSFGKAHRWMAKVGKRKHRNGMYIMAWRPTIELAAKSVGKRFVDGNYHILPNGKNMTLARFCKEYPRGIFYLQVNRHAVAVVDGQMLDWTAQTAGRRKIQQTFKLVEG